MLWLLHCAIKNSQVDCVAKRQKLSVDFRVAQYLVFVHFSCLNIFHLWLFWSEVCRRLCDISMELNRNRRMKVVQNFLHSIDGCAVTKFILIIFFSMETKIKNQMPNTINRFPISNSIR